MAIPVKYIGKKPHKIDSVTRSEFEWGPGETILVPEDIALRLFKYKDIWARGKEEDIADDAADAADDEVTEPEAPAAPRPSTSTFDDTRIGDLVAAIEMLDPEKEGDFDVASGLPTVEAVTLFAGFEPQEGEIQEAFARFLATPEGADSPAAAQQE